MLTMWLLQGILLQIFSKPLSDRPTVFVEIIQRIGCEREVEVCTVHKSDPPEFHQQLGFAQLSVWRGRPACWTGGGGRRDINVVPILRLTKKPI